MRSINLNHMKQDATQRAAQGMRIQGSTQISVGAVLFRFVADAVTSDQVCVKSPWWFQSSAVRQILIAARQGHRGDYSSASQARKRAALSDTWIGSGANYLLSAKLLEPLQVLWGVGRPIGTKSGHQGTVGLDGAGEVTEIETVADSQCVQFFIPGMWLPDIALKAVQVIARSNLAENPELEQGEIELFLAHASGR